MSTDQPSVTVLTCSAKLPRPLGIGLEVVLRRAGDGALALPAFRVARGRKLERYRVSARERELAAELLRGEVENLLDEAGRGRLLPRIDDSSVALASSVAPHNAVVMLSTCVRIALALQTARASLPRSDHEKAVFECWEIVARSTGAKFDPIREHLTHDVGTAGVGVGLSLDGPTWKTTLELGFRSSIADELKISKTEAHGTWDLWVGGELKLDDTEFDAAFVVRGAPEERVRELLSPNVRTQLCKLATLTDHLVLSHDGLHARIDRVVTEPTELARLLEVSSVLAESLTRRDRQGGPYR